MYSRRKFLKGKQFMVAEGMLYKSHNVYPEIIQTGWLDRLQKNLLKYNDCLYVEENQKTSNNVCL